MWDLNADLQQHEQCVRNEWHSPYTRLKDSAYLAGLISGNTKFFSADGDNYIGLVTPVWGYAWDDNTHVGDEQVCRLAGYILKDDYSYRWHTLVLGKNFPDESVNWQHFSSDVGNVFIFDEPQVNHADKIADFEFIKNLYKRMYNGCVTKCTRRRK